MESWSVLGPEVKICHEFRVKFTITKDFSLINIVNNALLIHCLVLMFTVQGKLVG